MVMSQPCDRLPTPALTGSGSKGFPSWDLSHMAPLAAHSIAGVNFASYIIPFGGYMWGGYWGAEVLGEMLGTHRGTHLPTICG